jgi:hypothetical protein
VTKKKQFFVELIPGLELELAVGFLSDTLAVLVDEPDK